MLFLLNLPPPQALQVSHYLEIWAHQQSILQKDVKTISTSWTRPTRGNMTECYNAYVNYYCSCLSTT